VGDLTKAVLVPKCTQDIRKGGKEGVTSNREVSLPQKSKKEGWRRKGGPLVGGGWGVGGGGG